MELIEKIALKMRGVLAWGGDPVLREATDGDVRDLAQAALTALIKHTGGDGVTEGDRDLAAKSAVLSEMRDLIRAGKCDDSAAVQDATRHRATAFAAGKAARDREIVEWLRGETVADWLESLLDGRRLADAIERGEV